MNSHQSRFLIVKMGETMPDLQARRGDYEHWFASALAGDPARIEIIDARSAELPSPEPFRSVVMTGSSSLVSDREPWSERAAAWLRRVVDAGVPFLGVCYGHQLLAHAFGGHVERNPKGREIGTIEVSLTADAKHDTLMNTLPASFVAQATHRESVLELPPRAICLAYNAHDPHQAFRLGERAWGVQFHPEFDADIARTYLEARADACREEGLNPDDLIAAIQESPIGPQILKRFGNLR